MGDKSTGEMTFIEHLEVLRFHLMRSAIAVVIGAFIAFINKRFLFDQVIFGPKTSDFYTFRILCLFSKYLHKSLPQLFDTADSLCIGGGFPELQNINMAGQFTTHIMVSLIAGFIISVPYILYEMWRFILPGLATKEAKQARGIVFFFLCIVSYRRIIWLLCNRPLISEFLFHLFNQRSGTDTTYLVGLCINSYRRSDGCWIGI